MLLSPLGWPSTRHQQRGTRRSPPGSAPRTSGALLRSMSRPSPASQAHSPQCSLSASPAPPRHYPLLPHRTLPRRPEHTVWFHACPPLPMPWLSCLGRPSLAAFSVTQTSSREPAGHSLHAGRVQAYRALLSGPFALYHDLPSSWLCLRALLSLPQVCTGLRDKPSAPFIPDCRGLSSHSPLQSRYSS